MSPALVDRMLHGLLEPIRSALRLKIALPREAVGGGAAVGQRRQRRKLFFDVQDVGVDVHALQSGC